MKDDARYHLLIDDGGGKCICIIKDTNKTKVSSEQKSKLIEMHGDYILVHIHYLSLSCYPRLDVFVGIEEYLENEK